MGRGGVLGLLVGCLVDLVMLSIELLHWATTLHVPPTFFRQGLAVLLNCLSYAQTCNPPAWIQECEDYRNVPPCLTISTSLDLFVHRLFTLFTLGKLFFSSFVHSSLYRTFTCVVPFAWNHIFCPFYLVSSYSFFRFWLNHYFLMEASLDFLLLGQISLNIQYHPLSYFCRSYNSCNFLFPCKSLNVCVTRLYIPQG